MTIKKIYIFAHARDCFDIKVFNENDKEIYDASGYCPYWIPGGGGDDIEFEIDNETGRILNWTPIKKEDLKNLEDEQD